MKINEVRSLLQTYDPLEQKLRDYYIQYQNPLPIDHITYTPFLGYYSSQSFFKNSASILQPNVELDEESILPEKDSYILKHPRYLFPYKHQHDFIELVYVYEGSCSQELNGKAIKMHEGEICIIAPKTMHSIYVFNDSIVINFLLKKSTFDKAFFDLMLRENIVSDFFTKLVYSTSYSPYLIMRTIPDQNLKDIVLKMLAEQFEWSESSRYVSNCLVSLFFAHLFKTQYHSFHIGSNDNLVSPILHYIHENYANVSLGSLSLHFNLSSAYISHIIKNNTGKTFLEILHSVRMEKTESLLINTKLSMLEICEAVGYIDLSYFVRTFKKQYNITPAEYRKLKTGSMPNTII